jgi:catechol 2,3-dioxygenase-like lactoylglutathione lyase family enzyme
MEQRLSVVTLGVANLGRACEFYERGLGWRRGNAGDEIAFYQLDGMILALYPRAALAEDAGLPNEPARFGGITLAYNTRDKAPGHGGRRHRSETRARGLLGRLLRHFRGSRRTPLGGRLEPPLVADRSRRRAAQGVTIGTALRCD